ncbi:MAG: dTDP-4-amino-4,6-dideoxygalactose transaminase [Kofleriaceae bacterium]
MAAAIPFHRPHATGREAAAIAEVLASSHWHGDGRFTREASNALSRWLGGGKVLLTTSCTHALELSALLLELAPGDEVILPSFTFVSTANAFALRGAKLVFADIDPRTLNLSPASVQARVTPRTKAIVPVHYAGVACELDAIGAIATHTPGAPIAIIEDNAHGLFATWRGKPLGSFGLLATQSFHDTKNVTCGEGGALAINDPGLFARAEIMREKGTDRARFFRGEVDKYTWVDLGSSYLPSELLAAVLAVQLEAATEIQAKRHAIWRRYHDELASWADRNGVARPHVPFEADHSAHLYWMRLRDLDARQRMIAHLASRGIGATFHYQPLNASEMGLRHGARPGDCPVSELAADTLVRLPLYPDLGAEAVDRVVSAVAAFKP